MIVAMFTNNYAPHISGVATSIARLERALRRQGHTVHVFAPWVPWHRDASTWVHRLPSVPFPPPFLPVAFPAASHIRRTLQDLRPDVVHVHHPFLIGPTAFRVAHALQVPVVFTYHAMYEQYVHYIPLFPRRMREQFARTQPLAFANRVDAVVAPSASVAEILRGRGLRSRLEVIPTGVETELFQRTQATRATTRAGWGIHESEVVIVSFGRLAPEKRFDVLLQAFARLRTLHTTIPIRLVLGGGGPSRHALEQETRALGLSDLVVFSGEIPHEGVPSFLSGGDLFAYTSPSETQGLVTLEALAAGLPAVVTDAPGNRDIVEHDQSGFVTAPTPEAVAAGMQRLVNDAALRGTMSQAARIRAQAFSEDACAERMTGLYQSLAHRS